MPRLPLRSNLLAAYLSAIMVCGTGWLAYQTVSQARVATARSRRDLNVMEELRAVGNRMSEANLAERDLIATGDPHYAATYTVAAEGAVRSLAALRDSASSYPDLASRIDSLGYFVRLRIAELDGGVNTPPPQRTKQSAQTSVSQRANQSDIKIDQLLMAISAALQRSGAGTEAAIGAQESVLVLVTLATAALAILLVIVVTAMHARSVVAQRRLKREMENQALQLHFQTDELTATNRQLEDATLEMQRQSVEAERSETRLAGILGSATDAVVSFDDEESIVYLNAAARRLFGMEEASIVGVRILGVVSGRSIAVFEEHMLAARRSAHVGATSPEVWDTLVVRPDGDEVPVEISMAYARTGKEGLFTAVLRDVTRQRQFEEEFRQAQKMEAVGRLAGGIAHDFNNLLTVIGASSDFLLHDLRGQSTSLSADVKEIKAATNRAATLTRQLLAFSRRQLVQPQMLDLNSVVREMETMLRRLIGEDTVLTTEYTDDIGMINLDRGQLEQVVVNLVVNARDAMPGGGTIRLCTGIETGQSDDLSTESVTLAVADSGVGLDEQTRARIFEPFFTTKEQGKGTGLGLSTVYGIVKASGGDIIVESEIGVGTEFRLTFPRHAELTAAPPVEAIEPDAARGYETVLVVEDEEPLRRLTRRILESRGYTVLDAPNGAEAIRLLAATTSHVHMVLTDVVMPGMSGRELVERILPVYPWLRVLFMSGYTEDMMLQHRVSELGITLLEKPFTGDQLGLAVRSTLDRTAEAAEPV
ncbi:MAG: ATP-binding protein [Gemmatimonadaceae bacterium]